MDEIRILLSQIVTQTTPNAGEKFNSKIIALERAVLHLLVVLGEGGGGGGGSLAADCLARNAINLPT